VRRSDIISGSLVAIFGLVMIFIIVPVQITSSSDYGLDPKFFPVAVLWLAVVMGVLLVATRISAPPDPDDSPPVLELRNWLFIGSFSIFLFLVFVAIKTLGYVAAGFLMVALMMIALDLRKRNWLQLAGVSILAPLIIYYTLYHLFSVQLPAGIVEGFLP
jgi:putative tricarboxylic transport membrane protein